MKKLTFGQIQDILGDEADYLLNHTSKTFPKSSLYLPTSDFVDRVFKESNRKPAVLRSLQTLFSAGNLGGTGYLSILPVDQGIEHAGGSAFAPNPQYFDPKNIVEFGIEAGCSGVASTIGVLASVARSYTHKIPFIVKLNHNETLSLPLRYRQNMWADVEESFDLGAVAVGATIYFGSEESREEIQEVAEAFRRAHELGMATILWAYTRNSAFKTDKKDYHTSADLTGQANHMAATLEADIVKQKQATNNGGYRDIGFGHTNDKVYSELTSDHPIDLVRYQVANCYMGRAGLINSGGGSGENDLQEAVRTAVINKRAGGMGLISGRKAFQTTREKGVEIFNAIQSVYLCDEVTIA